MNKKKTNDRQSRMIQEYKLLAISEKKKQQNKQIKANIDFF